MNLYEGAYFNVFQQHPADKRHPSIMDIFKEGALGIPFPEYATFCAISAAARDKS